ncbi:MAG: T9SS type A sorting domain-containing protein [Chitinophagaceae bacterium]|nr:T9SS type A sorting domain-containing protein [Chitinophagaceae bacterium]
MFKILLSIYVSFLALASYSQTHVPEWSPAEYVKEDPGRIITDLSSRLTESSKIILSWIVDGSLPDYFAIERSNNGKSYDVVSVLTNLSKQKAYSWTDDAPVKGRSFYRIRYSYKEGDSLYSKTLPVTVIGEPTFRFYPNPVDHVLIVRSESPLDVVITDASGRLRISQARITGLQAINVSSLEKGIYLIRFVNKHTNQVSQEKLVKN